MIPMYQCDRCGAEMREYWVYINYRAGDAHLCKECAGALTGWLCEGKDFMKAE